MIFSLLNRMAIVRNFNSIDTLVDLSLAPKVTREHHRSLFAGNVSTLMIIIHID